MTDVMEVVGEPDPPDADDPSRPPRPRWFAGAPARWLPASRPGRALAIVVALAVVVLVVGGIVRLRGDSPAPLTRADVDRSVQAGIAKARQQQRNAAPDGQAAYRKIVPSLVTVTAGDSLGAGVVINRQGAVLTALHVVAAGGRLQVGFADGTRAKATVARRQPGNDIAVLSVAKLPSVVVPAVMGDAAQVGDAVFPVGNPLGLEGSLSAGVVSALGRSIRTEKRGPTLKGLIQFDAAVNPGNSGGPLLDRDGQVIGIVTGLANPSGRPYFVGIGFAVPIETAGGAAGGPSK